jgi:3',5'-cyclic AMP phosphodiesterase CpdA
MLIAQITDTHIRPEAQLLCRLVDTAPFLVRCIARINALRPAPDVVLVTGDLVDGGLPEEYARLRALLRRLPCPAYVIPGNHDDRERLREAFRADEYLPAAGYLQYVVDDYPLRLIGLDSLLPGKVGGRLCADRLGWLDARLHESPQRPTVVFVHHPPFPTGIAWMDREALEGADALADVVRRHPQVERLLCGHIHRPIHVRWAGTLASTGPATAHQIPLDLQTGGPAVFVMEPSAFQLHLWRAGTGLISHVSYCESHSGPHPFR